jgi:predicted secreted protein
VTGAAMLYYIPAMRRALLLLVALPLAALSEEAREPLFNLVSLQAEASREVENDLLTAVLAAEAEGAEPAKLSAEVNRKMARALEAALEARGVRARSGSYRTWPVSEKGRIVRWRVRQELRLESGEFAAATALVGRLQQELVLAGLALSVSDEARRRAENALIAEALAALEERARVVRDAMRAKSYRVKDLQVATGGGLPPRPMLAEARSLAASAPPAIEPGTTRLQVTVSGTIQLQ